MREVDQMRRTGEPLLHDRHQRMTAGDHLGVFVLHQKIGGLTHGRGAMIFEFVHEKVLIAVAMNSIKLGRIWPSPWRRRRSRPRCSDSRCSGTDCLRALRE